MARMTPKERLKLTVSHSKTDRPPIEIYVTPEVDRMLSNHFNGASYIEAFNVDFRKVKPDGPCSITPPSGDSPYYRDMWGVGYSNVPNNAGGFYLEATDLPLARITTMDEVQRYPWPDPAAFDYSTIPEQIERVKNYAVTLGGPGIPDIINGVSFGRGMEQVLIDIATEDEVGVAIIDRRVNYYYEYCKRCLRAGRGKIDILRLGEDLGTQKGTTISPECFDRFFRPRLEKFYNLAHDYGAFAMMHSCGSTRAFQPRLIEMHLDILDAVQPEPEGQDPEGLKRDFGSKLTYCGMISTQNTLPHGTVEECRAEARHRIDVIGKRGGYIFAPAHCIQPDTPLENILAIYEEVTGKQFINR